MENVDREKYLLIREKNKLKNHIAKGKDYAYKMIEYKTVDLNYAAGKKRLKLKKDIQMWHRVLWHIDNLPKG